MFFSLERKSTREGSRHMFNSPDVRKKKKKNNNKQQLQCISEYGMKKKNVSVFKTFPEEEIKSRVNRN